MLTVVACTTATPSSSSPTTGGLADVVGVEVSGDPGSFTLAVAIRSDETGCDRYADWWEVISIDGQLLYRRILDHSHVAEQPFTRSGGPVPIEAHEEVWVRAHHHPGGYAGQAWRGSAQGGFRAETLPPSWPHLAEEEPVPDGCDF